jgi:hypothetical protein
MAAPGLHSTAGPCCSPRKMAPINMLYLDQDYNVILGKLPGMKVCQSLPPGPTQPPLARSRGAAANETAPAALPGIRLFLPPRQDPPPASISPGPRAGTQ